MPDPKFSNDEIQQRAYEIYQARGGTPGDPNADWQEAIRQLQQERSSSQQKRSVFSWLKRSLVRLEKRAIEPTANWLDKADIFRIIEKISPIIEAIGVIAGAIIIPVVIWQVGNREQEAKEQQEKAIRAQTAVQNYLNQLSDILATGKLKTDADLQTIVRASTLALLDSPDLQPDPELEDSENWRNDRKGQTIGYLVETGLIQVENPEQARSNNQATEPKDSVILLRDANLSGAFLTGADLTGADLSITDLSNASLLSANLSSADLSGANLSSANFNTADFSGTNLNGADLIDADFSGADLSGANLSFAFLGNANFNGTNFSNVDLSNAFLNDADLSGVQNWTERQLSEAKLCKTKLPADANLNPDRDCKELGISPD